MSEQSMDASRPGFIQGLVRRAVVGTVLGALVLAGLSLYGDVRQLASDFSKFSWTAFGCALVLSSSNYALRFVRWHRYLVALGVHLPVGESALVFLAGFVMSVTPGKFGEVLKSLLIFESHGISIARTAPVVIAERLTDVLALVLLTALGSLALERGVAIAATGAVLVCGIIAVIAIPTVGNACLTLTERIMGFRRIAAHIREAYGALAILVRPAPLVSATALGTLAWGLECAALGQVVAGFEGAAIDRVAAILAYAASTLAGALAMLPGGLGVTETSMTGLLQAFGEGVTPAIAAGSTLLVRLATLWWAVLLGLVALAILRARAQKAKPST
jgi:uncharacterized protein (TIRG00374 family)